MVALPKLIITGCNGQLGRELTDHFAGRTEVTGIDIDRVDILDRETVREAIVASDAGVVLHTAAYTDVDRAEAEPERAMAINADGTRNVALACREAGSRLIYYSTDYVFSGQSKRPYVESDLPDPINAYGRSKLEGERLVSEIVDEAAIMRIAWLYGQHGKNFVNTMLARAREVVNQEEGAKILRVVNDQTGCPTWAREVARQTEVVIEHGLTGYLHAAAEGWATWFDFAVAVFDLAGIPVEVEPCSSADFPRPAPRPGFTVLENARLRELDLCVMAHWRDALKEFFAGA